MNGSKVCFVDSNVWLYALLKGQDETKRLTARLLLQQNEPIISVQIVNEVCANLIRKAQFSEGEVEQLIESFYRNYQVIGLNRAILLKASELRSKHSFSFWDSLVISSALHSGAPVLYSEDMQDGLVIESRLRVINPFAVE